MRKIVWVVVAVLAPALGLAVSAKADSVKQDKDKSVWDVDFDHHGRHFGLSDERKACGDFVFGHHSAIFGEDADEDNDNGQDTKANTKRKTAT